MTTFTTIGQLERHIKKEYPEAIDNIMHGDSFFDAMPDDAIELLRKSINLFRVNVAESDTLRNPATGLYAYTSSKENLKFFLLCDYLEECIRHPMRFRSINIFKRYAVEKSV